MSTLAPCRSCEHEVSTDARRCPSCGAPEPWNPRWDGYGYEYKSPIRIASLPLLHISFKYRNRKPVPAVGVVAIGQFGAGVITIAQFGVGLVGICQFTIALLAVAQFAVALAGICQIGVVGMGVGQATLVLQEWWHTRT